LALAAAQRPVIDENTDLRSLSDQQIFDLTQNIKDEEAQRRPLIGVVAPLTELRDEYVSGSQVMIRKIDWLQANPQNWKGFRRARGDGDCFYRSLAFAYVERLLNSLDKDLAVMTALSKLESTLPMLEGVGFQRMVFEDFYETFRDLIQSIIQPGPVGVLDASTLLVAFQTPEISNSIVVFLRLLTSAQIRLDPELFAPFLFHPETGDPMDVIPFCEIWVEGTGKEADHPQITALSRVLGVSVHVAYLSTGVPFADESTTTVDFVKFEPEGADTSDPIVLLFRPGHYDILEKRSKEHTAF
jgi:ubiquitin thioesterase protein OTUB1